MSQMKLFCSGQNLTWEDWYMNGSSFLGKLLIYIYGCLHFVLVEASLYPCRSNVEYPLVNYVSFFKFNAVFESDNQVKKH